MCAAQAAVSLAQKHSPQPDNIYMQSIQILPVNMHTFFQGVEGVKAEHGLKFPVNLLIVFFFFSPP